MKHLLAVICFVSIIFCSITYFTYNIAVVIPIILLCLSYVVFYLITKGTLKILNVDKVNVDKVNANTFNIKAEKARNKIDEVNKIKLTSIRPFDKSYIQDIFSSINTLSSLGYFSTEFRYSKFFKVDDVSLLNKKEIEAVNKFFMEKDFLVITRHKLNSFGDPIVVRDTTTIRWDDQALRECKKQKLKVFE